MSFRNLKLILGLVVVGLFGALLVGILVHRARQFDRIFEVSSSTESALPAEPALD